MYFYYYGIVLTFALDSLQHHNGISEKNRCVLTCTILRWMERRPYPLPDYHPWLILKPRSRRAERCRSQRLVIFLGREIPIDLHDMRFWGVQKAPTSTHLCSSLAPLMTPPPHNPLSSITKCACISAGFGPMGLYAAGDDVDASGVVSSSAAGGGFANRLT